MRTAAVYGKALYADLYRAFLSKRFAFSVLLVITVLLAASFEGIALHTEVLYVFSLVMYGMPAMLVIIGGASAYAGSIVSDIEHRYIRGILSRTGVRQYIFSKMISIFLTGMLNVGLGIFLYALLLHLKLPWVQAESSQYQHLLLSGGLRFFLSRGWFTAYFCCGAFNMGRCREYWPYSPRVCPCLPETDCWCLQRRFSAAILLTCLFRNCLKADIHLL